MLRSHGDTVVAPTSVDTEAAMRAAGMVSPVQEGVLVPGPGVQALPLPRPQGQCGRRAKDSRPSWFWPRRDVPTLVVPTWWSLPQPRETPVSAWSRAPAPVGPAGGALGLSRGVSPGTGLGPPVPGRPSAVPQPCPFCLITHGDCYPGAAGKNAETEAAGAPGRWARRNQTLCLSKERIPR